jgi:hypothetical protein
MLSARLPVYVGSDLQAQWTFDLNGGEIMNARVIMFIAVSALFAAGAIAATEPQNDPRPASEVNSPSRSLSAIQADVHTALRAEALSRRHGPNAPEVIRLIDLYREMAAHPKRDKSTLLMQLGLQLRSRLKNVREQIQRRNSLPERPATKETLPALVVPETRVLAQQVGVPGGAALAPGAQPAAIQPGAARTIDYGPDLVELIQQTISPATWDINGGNGSIVYFAPLRVIVVSAPGTVHNQIGGALGQLRAAP